MFYSDIYLFFTIKSYEIQQNNKRCKGKGKLSWSVPAMTAIVESFYTLFCHRRMRKFLASRDLKMGRFVVKKVTESD